MLKDKYPIIELCRTLKCSKSGYYDWMKLGRPEIKKYDILYNDVVMKMYEENYGDFIIHMRLCRFRNAENGGLFCAKNNVAVFRDR